MPSREKSIWAPTRRIIMGKALGGGIAKLKWEKIPGWECLYVHKEQQLFLSVYVDDFKMVGKGESSPNMWKLIRKDIDLEPETELSENVYLGYNQRQAKPELHRLKEKNDLFKKLTTHASQESTNAEGDPCDNAGSNSSRSCAMYPAADISKTKSWNYDMIGHAEQCVQRWCELANKEIKDLPMVGTLHRRSQSSTRRLDIAGIAGTRLL